MARIDFSSIERVEKNGSIHEITTATYHFFEIGAEKYFQLDTYGTPNRKSEPKQSQVIQFNKKTAERLVKLLSKEFDL
ncbi:MAG: hypothetical protein LBC87_03390 [Fibromonadaceae bacterium]|jgi:hypothetical protein|nr:hypothetical protein [Fibromonadaceae bacterium]